MKKLINHCKHSNRMRLIKLSQIGMAALFFTSSVAGYGQSVYGATASEVLPNGGAGLMLTGSTDLKSVTSGKSAQGTYEDAIDSREEMQKRLAQNAKDAYDELIKNIAVADTDDFIYVREQADKSSKVLGKMYDDSVGEILKEENGWFLVESGSLTGYVDASNCIVGKEAEDLAPEIGYELAVVNSPSLYVRTDADKQSDVLCVVKNGEEYLVKGRQDGWLLVETISGDGWISEDYADVEWQFSQAESNEEEAIRLAEESYEKGKQLVEYALQFVGGPYVYGGTSLTKGCDCSGFTMALYDHFGISLSHASDAQRYAGVAVDGIENAQPGDIIIYSGHVAIYMGNGQIVHAANSRLGIVVSGIDFMTMLGIRRIF